MTTRKTGGSKSGGSGDASGWITFLSLAGNFVQGLSGAAKKTENQQLRILADDLGRQLVDLRSKHDGLAAESRSKDQEIARLKSENATLTAKVAAAGKPSKN